MGEPVQWGTRATARALQPPIEVRTFELVDDASVVGAAGWVLATGPLPRCEETV